MTGDDRESLKAMTMWPNPELSPTWRELGEGVRVAPVGTPLPTTRGKFAYAEEWPHPALATWLGSGGGSYSLSDGSSLPKLLPWQRAYLQTAMGESVRIRIGNGHTPAMWPGGKRPAWLETEAYGYALRFAHRLSVLGAGSFDECMQAVLRLMAPAKPAEKTGPLPKPSTTTPFWANDVTKRRRKRNRVTNGREVWS
ncbi:hypothetical protein ACT89R_01765 [Rhodococcus qingshengii]